VAVSDDCIRLVAKREVQRTSFYKRGSEGRSPLEADDIFLLQRLFSEQDYHINLGNLDCMASV